MTKKEAHEVRLAVFIKRHRIRKKDGKLVFYKAVREDLGSWWRRNSSGKSAQGGIYTPGTEVTSRRCNTDPYEECGEGLHVSTRKFAMRFQRHGAPTVIQVLVDPKDIACVPEDSWHGFTRKIRVRRLYVDHIVAKDKTHRRKKK